MKELIAINAANGMKIIERYVDGTKYLKVTPKSFMPLIIEQLKSKLVGQPIEIEESDNGWIRYNKKGTSEGFEKANEKLNEQLNEDIDEENKEEYVLKKEAEMLKQAGFNVQIREI